MRILVFLVNHNILLAHLQPLLKDAHPLPPGCLRYFSFILHLIIIILVILVILIVLLLLLVLLLFHLDLKFEGFISHINDQVNDFRSDLNIDISFPVLLSPPDSLIINHIRLLLLSPLTLSLFSCLLHCQLEFFILLLLLLIHYHCLLLSLVSDEIFPLIRALNLVGLFLFICLLSHETLN